MMPHVKNKRTAVVIRMTVSAIQWSCHIGFLASLVTYCDDHNPPPRHIKMGLLLSKGGKN